MNSNKTNPTPETSSSISAHLAACLLGSFAAISLYSISLWLPIPLLLYLPQEGRFVLDKPAGAIAMGYYGLLLNALAAFVVAYLIGRIPLVSEWLRKPRTFGAAATLTIVVLLIGLVSYAIEELVHWGSLPGVQ